MPANGFIVAKGCASQVRVAISFIAAGVVNTLVGLGVFWMAFNMCGSIQNKDGQGR